MKAKSTFPGFADAIASPSWPQCEELIKQFEEAWQAGSSPAIDDYLLASGEIRGALLVELIHVDLEFRLKQSDQPLVESYLASFPELAGQSNVVVELLASEYQIRRRHSADLSVDGVASRFPQFRQEILKRLAVEPSRTAMTARSQVASAEIPLPNVTGYEVLSQIGRGGMGIVYKARDPSLDRLVALKFLPPEYARDSDRLGRFLHEARTASSLNHPNICTVHSLGEHAGHPFLVLEFVEGRTLHALSASQPGCEQIIDWLGQAARALAAAHAAGVVHRDIKPENIMVRGDGYVKVLDFGLARRLTGLSARGSPAPDTDPGAMMGTIAYMSPEQTRGSSADRASDIFSLGVVAFQLLTGVHPFDAETPFAMMSAIASAPVVPPARCNPQIPAALSGLIEAMLHKDARLRPTAAEVETALAAIGDESVRAAPAVIAARPIVRRQAELEVLQQALAEADAGRGSFVCIAGEPGIGKTTLVEDFLADSAASSGRRLVARGNCSELLGESEAYLPVIDALDNLLRSESTGAAARLLRIVAPAWYSQLTPAARGGPADEALAPRASSQGALLREFVTFLQEAARIGTVVLFVDDVHWSDHATVDLLAHLGRHCRGLRLLVITTCRPTEMLIGLHPFRRVMLELQQRGDCTELTLEFLDRQDVARYLDLAYPNHAFPAALASQIHARTEGNPLFMEAMLGYLGQRGVLAKVDGVWSMVGELPDLSRELPQSIRGAIERKVDQLESDDRQLLAAASVLGQEFDAAIVSDALEASAAEIEERLQRLERVHGLVRLLREQEFPDGTLTQRYRFVHALYQHALYDNLSPARRSSIAAALAGALERRRGSEGAVAAELACLYEVGRDFARAARQFYLAAQNAARVFAHREAVVLARRGLKLLAALPETAERRQLELPLQMALGLQLQVTEGYATAEAQRAYLRSRDLSPGTDKPFPALWGLWLYHKVRSELRKAQELADELLALARRLNEPDLALQAHQALGMTAFCRGQLAASLSHTEQVAALYDADHHRTHAFLFGHDPSVIAKAYGAVVLWLLGYPEAADQQSAEAIRHSADLSPTSQAVALHFAAMVHQLRRDDQQTRQHAEACSMIGVEHGLSFWQASGSVLSGWALVAGGEPPAGIARLRRGLSDWRATGSVTYETYYLGLLAEVLASQQEIAESQGLVDHALALVQQTGEGFWAAELYRLRGNLWLHDPAHSAYSTERAAADYRRAVEIATNQGALSLALRAAISLARLQSARSEARDRLASIYEQFAEGFETADLREAKTLLEAP